MKAEIENLLNTKPILPGTLEKHYNVCGKAGCACKDRNNPRKHGPYYRLSYSVKGKNSSVYIPKNEAEAVLEMTENYREARTNTQTLALSMIESYREKGLRETLAFHARLVDGAAKKKTGGKPESAKLRDIRNSRDKWKTKAKERHRELEKNKVRIRDLIVSRENWKTKAMTFLQERKALEARILKLEKEKLKADIKKNA